jgi:hypothetical protein
VWYGLWVRWSHGVQRSVVVAWEFERAPTPTQQKVESLVLDVHARVMRLLEKRGLLEVGADIR